MSTAPELAEQDGQRLQEEGWVVLPDVLGAGEIASLREVLAPLLAEHPFGRNPFEGQRTERVYALLAKCPEVAALVEHPRILAIGDALLEPGYLLSSVQAINIHPGEKAQALHCDDDAGAPPRPRPPQGFSTVWALDDFTADNGSTRLVPGSHLWDADREVCDEDAISVRMSAGAVLVYLGGVSHGGGQHRADAPRLGVSVIYCQPWLRQFENLTLSVPPAFAARYSKRIQRMLGYSMLGPMGNVDGRDPIRLVEAEGGGSR
jgi:ectoine hydroxylase-related dioxygenase (phytanoyl-CoA dioxygenase family)